MNLSQYAIRQRTIADQPTVKASAITLPTFTASLKGYWAEEATRMLSPGETAESLVVRLMLYYQHNQQEDDMALVEALGGGKK